MLSYPTLRKLVNATARRLGCPERKVFVNLALAEGYSDEASERMGGEDYDKFMSGTYRDNEELENFCLSCLNGGKARRRNHAVA